MRKYTLNEDYFEHIDTEEKAYWLGFIAADGCIYRRDKTVQLSINLKASDIDHLENFRKAIGSDRPISFLYPKLNGKTHPQRSLRVCKPRFIEHLEKHGIHPRKSLTAECWRGPDHLLRHYWRGVVDGDGWISHIDSAQRANFWTVGLCGSEAMVSAFAEWVQSEVGLETKLQTAGTARQVHFGGTFGPQKVAALLYDDASIYLSRKYERAQELKSQCFPVSKFAPREDVSDEMLISAYDETHSIKKVGKKFNMDSRNISRRLKDCGVSLLGRWP